MTNESVIQISNIDSTITQLDKEVFLRNVASVVLAQDLLETFILFWEKI